MRFTKSWSLPIDDAIRRPILGIYFPTAKSPLLQHTFVVDGGADISMGPRQLCEALGLEWEKGAPQKLTGISQKPECDVNAMIHVVEIHVLEAARQLVIPFCFADGPAPLLLGREGFFDAFRITLDKQNYVTVFESY